MYEMFNDVHVQWSAENIKQKTEEILGSSSAKDSQVQKRIF